jgi:hypothetical protein
MQTFFAGVRQHIHGNASKVDQGRAASEGIGCHPCIGAEIMQQKVLQDRQAEGKRFGMIARRHRRSAVSGMTASIADRNLLYDGRVADVCTGGFRLQRKSDDFTGRCLSYTVIISVGRKRYRVLAKPCWIRNDGANRDQEIGFRIIDAPWEWLELVMLSLDDDRPNGEFNA